LNTATFENVDRLEQTAQVREALQGLMDIDRYAWDERGILTLRGQLLGSTAERYRTIRARLETLGFTPFLRRAGEQDELLAVPSLVDRQSPRIGLPIALFLATIVAVLLTGALYEGVDILSNPAGIVAGIPYAATLIAILFTHEMGHYVVGRLRKAPVSLPYFIPLPFISFGTLGAVIVQREPMEDRKTILEIGIAGPLAGLAIAIPLLFYGLATSQVGPPPAGGYFQEGNSLLYIAAKWLVFGRYLPGGGVDVQLNPVAWGAWVGLLVTMLNLLPIGQLDGGHIAYALLGRHAEYLAYAMIAICLTLGVLVSISWIVLPVLALAFGPRHPPPLNDIPRLDGKHIALAVFGLLVFVFLFMPNPLVPVGL
jgi:membrane-associated protease RseP (regulator of RpoE activity)